jgi:hypothetical protein
MICGHHLLACIWDMSRLVGIHPYILWQEELTAHPLYLFKGGSTLSVCTPLRIVQEITSATSHVGVGNRCVVQVG